MLKRFVPALVAAGLLLGLHGFTAYAIKKNVADDSAFSRPLPEDQRIIHVLNRLTFGPRPGDIEQVRALGLQAWIDQQLHPNTIPENPDLASKLQPLDSLRMSQHELASKYPSRQTIEQMVKGKIAFPSDPDERMMIQRVAARFEKKQNGEETERQHLSDLLNADQVRIIQKGAPQEKIDLLRSLPAAQLDNVIEATPQGIRQQMMNAAPPDLRRKLEKAGGPDQVITNDLVEGKVLRAIYANRQLEEVLVDFWFNHFNIYIDKGADRYLTTVYERTAIRPHVLGKFYDLLLATAESPAMMFYLDNWESQGPIYSSSGNSKGLNENYGRELMELHTLGVDGGYTQKDVTEVARCFTGWSIKDVNRHAEFFYNSKVHDDGPKTVLDVRIKGGGRAEGLKVLAMVAHHPSTAHFISRKLAQRFVADNPPEALVERMAKTFLSTDGDLREVMTTMLNSPEFWSEGAFRSKMKSPLEMVASSVRALGADVDYSLALTQQIAQLGEPLYRKQEPTGYSNSGREWMNSASLLARMNFGLALVGNRIPGVKADLTRFTADDPKQIAKALLLSDLPADAAAVIQGVLDEQSGPNGMARPLLVAGLTLGSPEFQKR